MSRLRAVLVGAAMGMGMATTAVGQRAAAPRVEARSAPVTVIVVRHAEKATEPASDPPLTAAGEARAKALLDAVRDADVTAIITTQLLRTRATAAPTAAALGITPEVVQSAGATHAQDVAAAVRRHPGQTVLVVGHSNTIPAIIAALGGSRPSPICDLEYDGMYIVRVGDARTGVIRSRYGEPSRLDASCSSAK